MKAVLGLLFAARRTREGPGKTPNHADPTEMDSWTAPSLEGTYKEPVLFGRARYWKNLDAQPSWGCREVRFQRMRKSPIA